MKEVYTAKVADHTLKPSKYYPGGELLWITGWVCYKLEREREKYIEIEIEIDDRNKNNNRNKLVDK